MEKSEKENKKRNANNRLGMAVIAGVALMVLGFTASQSKTLERRLSYYQTKAATLEEAIENEQQRAVDIEEKMDYMLTDEYIEEVARNKLGLVKNNEIVFEEKK